MPALLDPFHTLKRLENGALYYSLPELARKLGLALNRLPFSIRIMLESLLRHCGEAIVKQEDVLKAAKWNPQGEESFEIPFIVSRVLLQDFTGVPLLVDLAAMRDAMAAAGEAPTLISPKVDVDLVVDHSVQVDRAATVDAFDFNLKLEFHRNLERYRFLKWGEAAFQRLRVVPPGIGIVHQINLEYLATVVAAQTVAEGRLLYFDTLVGTDSHTTMINGLGVLGWGVGGIEAQAAMLQLPCALTCPEVIGVHLSGHLASGVTATDFALFITELLRQEGVVNKFVEFFGEGASQLDVATRATVANMAPEYGATTAFFAVDDKTLEYLQMTARQTARIEEIKAYLQAQELFGTPTWGQIDYSKIIECDLNAIVASVSGPKRPQDRLSLSQLKTKFHHLLGQPAPQGYGKKVQAAVHIYSEGDFSSERHHESGGINKQTPHASWSEDEMVTNRPYNEPEVNPGYLKMRPSEAILSHGSIVIAAITSCTNTSNPSLLIAAGLVAKKAVERGLRVNPIVKTSLAPGSRVVTEYLNRSGLQTYLDQLGFNLVGYGCTTCIGNSGPLDEKVEQIIRDHDLVVASVLSGNRNFEARIHSSVKANFLMSPPLVVAFALHGKIDIDMTKEPIGFDQNNRAVFLNELWPSEKEVKEIISQHISPQLFIDKYQRLDEQIPAWGAIEGKGEEQYEWQKQSSYIQKPPYFENFSRQIERRKSLCQMRCLALLGDSVTTDHISPAGYFRETSEAGRYLLACGIEQKDFNSYGSRRGNHHVMKRGTFGNVRLKNKLADKEGGFTRLMPEGNVMSIYEACEHYERRHTPLIIFAGQDYGMGSSRDWAAKGTLLLGVRVVVAKSFERIHRSNLIGMGVLPLQFMPGISHESLQIKGDELFSIEALQEDVQPQQIVQLRIERSDKKVEHVELNVRIDTPLEALYYKHGGIMPYMLRQILNR